MPREELDLLECYGEQGYKRQENSRAGSPFWMQDFRRLGGNSENLPFIAFIQNFRVEVWPLELKQRR